MAYALYFFARMGGSDPCDAAGALRDLPIKSQRNLLRDERTLGHDPVPKGLVQSLRFIRADSYRDLQARATKPLKSLSSDDGVRIAHGSHHALDSRSNA